MNLLSRNQKNFIYLFSITYLLIWSVAPAFLASSVALDVSEGINWGSEWQWGYYKHPPFSSWVLYSFYVILGHIGPYLLSQLCVVTTLWCNYQLGKRAWSSSVGLLGGILTMGIFYYTYPTLEFNHNIAQFPIWSGLALSFYLAIAENKWLHWLWLGILAGIGMLTKYSVIFLLLPLALYLLLPQNWHYLKNPKPWLAILLALLIFSPHLYWLAHHDWMPFTYAQKRGENNVFLQAHFSWLKFFGTQILAHIPLMIIVLWQYRKLKHFTSYRQSLTNSQLIIWFLWGIPILVILLLSLVLGIELQDMWGVPLWGLSGLLVASLFDAEKLFDLLPKALKGIAIWLVIITLLMLTYLQFGHRIRHKPSRMDWNSTELAKQVTQTWQKYSLCPLDNLSGNERLSGLAAMNLNFPSQVLEGDVKKTTWMTPQRFEKYGTITVWEATSYLPGTRFINKKNKKKFHWFRGQWEISWKHNRQAPPLKVKWIVFVPKNCLKK